ncbi:hypothetical protein MJO29_011391 [Puccinia striiformis f. sp. tritici]|nr:hypothetical protein MJO29_011391 [Puccinia striiformis f. sp. tritici]
MPSEPSRPKPSYISFHSRFESYNVAVAVNNVSSSLANFRSKSLVTANVTLAPHTTPSPHTTTTPNLAVPSSTYENSRSQPENNNANRTTASDLLKDAPKVKNWPKFTGEGEYNHVEFIRTIDMFQEDFELRDIDIAGKFCLIFQHSAKKWYLMIRKIHRKQPWAWWKEQINTKWGNAAWVYRMEEAFDKAHFEPGTSKPLLWFSKQKDILSAIFPDMSESGLHERILKKCGGDLEHAVKCRTNRSSSTEDIINALEDIAERTKIARRCNKSYTPTDNKTDPKKTTVNRLDNKPFVRKCHKCDSPHHLANVCTKPRKAINAIEQGTSNSPDENDTPTEEDEEESLPDKSEGEDSNDLDISAIEANYNITEEEMSSYLPQLSNPSREIVHITDAKLIKTRPGKGKGYTAGTSSITQVICEKEEAKMLLDQGAFCSVVSRRYLKQFLPNWRDNLMPLSGLSLHSCNSTIKALGIIEINLLLPYPSGSVRIKVEFIVLEDGRNDYFILGTDYLKLYGFDIHNSKDSLQLDMKTGERSFNSYTPKQ